MSEEQVTRVREAVLADLAVAREGFERALEPPNSNSFTWHGEVFWVDRIRCFVYPGDKDKPAPESLSAYDPDQVDWIDIFAGEYQRVDASWLERMWAELLTGQPDYVWELEGAKVINLAIAQPLINPAFRSIYWLALAYDLGATGDASPNFFDVIGPMIYLQVHLPELVPAPRDVRRAQIDFVEKMFPGSTDAASELLPEAEWASQCEVLLLQHQQLVDRNVFAPLLMRTGVLSALGF